jgi:hypothetical protein
MKKNIKIIITKNTNNNQDNQNNLEIINSEIDDNDIYKKNEKNIYNLEYIINILQYLIKKYIILILLILIIIYFYRKYT